MSKLVTALLQHQRIVTENSNASRLLYKSGYGTKLADGRLSLSPLEALYLAETKRLLVVDSKNKQLSFDRVMLKFRSKDLWTSYVVFRDLCKRGYFVKTGLKFGANFRVYEDLTDHAKWLVSTVRAHDKFTWHEFSSKNRVAKTTNKKLLVAVVDEEDSVSYWETSWIKP